MDNNIVDIWPPSETRYTAGYRAHESQMRENTNTRVKRKEEASKRVRRAFKRFVYSFLSFTFGIASVWALEGDATFAVFAFIVALFFIFGKDVFEE